ncbi:MAG: hypothetical protein WCK47_03030 [bacterium]|nr:hypothetical protein [Candidatus Sumerlaeota bacterium]
MGRTLPSPVTITNKRLGCARRRKTTSVVSSGTQKIISRKDAKNAKNTPCLQSCFLGELGDFA